MACKLPLCITALMFMKMQRLTWYVHLQQAQRAGPRQQMSGQRFDGRVSRT